MVARMLNGQGEITMGAILGVEWEREQWAKAEAERMARGEPKPSYRHLVKSSPAKPKPPKVRR